MKQNRRRIQVAREKSFRALYCKIESGLSGGRIALTFSLGFMGTFYRSLFADKSGYIQLLSGLFAVIATLAALCFSYARALEDSSSAKRKSVLSAGEDFSRSAITLLFAGLLKYIYQSFAAPDSILNPYVFFIMESLSEVIGVVVFPVHVICGIKSLAEFHDGIEKLQSALVKAGYARFFRAQQAFKRGDLEQALVDFSAVCEDSVVGGEMRHLALLWLARSYHKTKQSDMALEYYDQLISTGSKKSYIPSSIEYAGDLIAQEKGGKGRAISVYTRLLEIYPDFHGRRKVEAKIKSLKRRASKNKKPRSRGK